VQHYPILWTFRRCPFAIRARLAIHASGITVDLREILLRAKPAAFLATSPKATVPVIDTGTRVISESRDIMHWALDQNDPARWRDMPQDAQNLIDLCDGPFKIALDHCKYAVRYPDLDLAREQAKALEFIDILENLLCENSYLCGAQMTMADMAILPFVRQFVQIDPDWFAAQNRPAVARWLADFVQSARFAAVMQKYPAWQTGQDPLLFAQNIKG
jgi:glutathione S-transferase